MIAPISTLGALALECSAPMARSALAREAAAELADHVAADLARFLPGVEQVDLALAAAAFDPSELLRAGWPVHAALDALVERAPEPHLPRVMGFGAHEGQMPEGLEPDPALHGGPLRLVPFVLRGDPRALAAVARGNGGKPAWKKAWRRPPPPSSPSAPSTPRWNTPATSASTTCSP